MRSALLLTLGVCFLMGNFRWLASLNGMQSLFGGTMGVLSEAAFAVLIFGGAAYLGLYVLDGDQTKILPRGALSRPQILWLALLGAAMTAPASLFENVLHGVLGRSGIPLPRPFSPVLPGNMLLRLLKSALLVPVLEELFFRGYLEGALERYGKWRAAAVSALCFAAVHMGGKGSAPMQWLLYAAMGLLFSAVRTKTGSLLAPMLTHGCYNAALLLLDFMGFGDWFARLSFISCMVRLPVCIGFAYCLKRVWTARGTRAEIRKIEKLTKKEIAQVAVAVIAAFASALIAG